MILYNKGEGMVPNLDVEVHRETEVLQTILTTSSQIESNQ